MNFNQTVYQVLENMSNFEDVFKRLGHIEQEKMVKIFEQAMELLFKDNGSYQQCVLKGGCVIIAWFGLIWFIFGDAYSYVERLFYTNEQK